jgi:hypothetical protein
MKLSTAEYYDIVQLAIHKEIDPKLLSFDVVEFEEGTNIWGKAYRKTLDRPFSIITVRGTNCYFKVEGEFYSNSRSVAVLNQNYPALYSAWIGGETEDKKRLYYDMKFELSMSPTSTDIYTENLRLIGRKIDYTWNLILEEAKVWIDNVFDEIFAIEEISRLTMIPEFITNSYRFGDFDENYSDQEIQGIKKGIGLLKASISDEFDLGAAELRIISEKLDQLHRKVDQLNKFDFRTVFFGILTNIASSILYDNAPKYWGLVKGAFNSIMLGDSSAGDLLV